MRVRRVNALVGCLLLGAALVALTARPASAAVITVDDTADGAPVAADCTDATPGNCSVRDAFALANTNSQDNELVLQSGVGYDLTDCNELDLHYTGGFDLTIQGNGGTIRQTCPAANDSRVLRFSGSGAFTLNDATITGSTATTGGGGIEAGNDNAVLTINNSTITDNRASFGAGIGTAGTVTVRNSTITANTASGALGGGGVRSFNDPVTIINSTLTGNTTPGGPGGGIAVAQNGVVLVYATVVGNSSPTSANVAAGTATTGGLTSFGSVISGPQGGGANCVADSTTSNGFNFSDDASCGFTSTGDTQDAGDPDLGSLASNGGATQTMLPQAGSPLIDAIPAALCQADGASGITSDQRGVTRPEGPGCDIGAVEVEPTAPPDGPGRDGAGGGGAGGVGAGDPATPVVAVVRFTG
jgi:hypothetical protein